MVSHVCTVVQALGLSSTTFPDATVGGLIRGAAAKFPTDACLDAGITDGGLTH